MSPKTPILVSVLLALAFVLAGCGREDEAVLLRYAPQVGGTYRYELEIHRPRDPIVVTGEMHVLSQDEEGYQIQFSGTLFDEMFSESLLVSDRHNSNDPGYISLNLPADPVRPAAEWAGAVPWYFENYYVLDPTEIRLPASYKLLEIQQGESGRYAVIEQKIEADVAIDGQVFHIGQVGVRWDRAGRITQVYPDYAAAGKLHVGDVVIGINGHIVAAAGELNWLAEKYIQRPKEARSVTFTILRDGRELDVAVEKSIDKLAVLKVSNVRDHLRITFDVERGILLSAQVGSSQDIVFTSPAAGTFPIVDNYGGFSKFGYLEGLTTYQDHQDSNGVAWTLSLVDSE